ncbi:tail protein X [Roseateles flavus]|uniref:Tail protein X n=1 Tax=Roseateles flavus TaxID=3149041 RepID=A0ABV0GG48_9BURK
MRVVHAQQQDSIDSIAWRYYERSSGVVEAIVKANPELVAFGAFLPQGTPVKLPDLPSSSIKPTVQLWN